MKVPVTGEGSFFLSYSSSAILSARLDILLSEWNVCNISIQNPRKEEEASRILYPKLGGATCCTTVLTHGVRNSKPVAIVLVMISCSMFCLTKLDAVRSHQLHGLGSRGKIGAQQIVRT